MGFDRVDYKCKCPNCGEEVTEFQSKSGECDSRLLQAQDVNNFYSECDSCKTWIEFYRISYCQRQSSCLMQEGLFDMKYGPLLDVDKYSKLVYIRNALRSDLT
jgi:hypothetical protein